MTSHVGIRSSAHERGVALAIALMFTFIAGGVIVSGAILLSADREMSELRFRREHQAAQFARSGLTEAMSWFRRQPGQPVTDFRPLRDTTAAPPILDTDDPNIGLVRQFRIEGDVWGRYEVWREDNADPDPLRLDFRRKYEVKDISAEHGFTGGGNVWLVRSIGYVFRQRDDTVAFNVKPNHVLAVTTLEGEMRRLSLKPPGQAAISVGKGSNCTVNTNGRVRGGTDGAGVIYPTGSGTPIAGPSSANRVTGTPSMSPADPYDDSVKAVFGVSRSELRAMADLVVTNSADFPDPVPDNSLIFVEGVPSLKFSSARSLNGTGVLFVDGNVSIISGNNSSFSGMLYINGNLTLRETSDIYGAIVVTGNFTAQGTGDYATVWYDDDALNSLRFFIGQYRWSGAFRTVINRE